MVFVPLAMGAELPDDAGNIYQYLDQAAPMSVNGLPMFFGFRVLTRDDNERLQPLVDEYQQMRARFAGTTGGA